jgi:hypothetical protein
MDASQVAYADGSKVWVYDLIDVDTRLFPTCVTSVATHY